jgi:hypothetical protein
MKHVTEQGYDCGLGGLLDFLVEIGKDFFVFIVPLVKTNVKVSDMQDVGEFLERLHVGL